MPCYLFTFHAYGTWMPDRVRGYTKRGKGQLPADREMAERYRENMKEQPVSFSDDLQRAMIEETLKASEFQRFRVEAAGSDPTHLHDLVSWRDRRAWVQVRRGLRTSLTKRLNDQFGKRTWFIESSSRKRCKDRDHYDYLVTQYLPDHRGWKYSKERGMYL